MSTSVSVKKTAGKAVVPKRQKKSEFYKLRLKQALTIEAAAELMGVTTQTIQSWDQKGAPRGVAIPAKPEMGPSDFRSGKIRDYFAFGGPRRPASAAAPDSARRCTCATATTNELDAGSVSLVDRLWPAGRQTPAIQPGPTATRGASYSAPARAGDFPYTPSKLATAYLQLREKHDLSCWGPEWKGFYFSHRRGRLCYKRSMSFDPKTLQQVESWLAVYNRVESAKVRYTMDGISQQEAIAIAFGAPLVTQSNVYKNACDGTVINSNGGRL